MRNALIVVLLGVACAQQKGNEAPKRIRIERVGRATFDVVPAEGQLPYCLLYTVNRTGLTRQLTISRRNQSFECPAGRSVGGHHYRVPLEDGPVKIYALFTSQPVPAAAVAIDILDQKDRQHLSVMDMRLPGGATLEVAEFTPQPEEVATVGEELSPPPADPDKADAGTAP